jgi:hypothetical protein
MYGALPNDTSIQHVQKLDIISILLIKLSYDVINQMVKAMMKLIMHKLFSEHMMTIEKTLKKDMLKRVIQDAVPHCFGPNGKPYALIIKLILTSFY